VAIQERLLPSSALARLLDNDTPRRDFYDHDLVAGINNAVADALKSYLSQSVLWFYRPVTRTSNPPRTHMCLIFRGRACLALLGSLDPTKPLSAFNDIKGAIAHMPDSNIRDTLFAHLADANGSPEKLRDGIATWFASWIASAFAFLFVLIS
jgi:hypothetical protein